MSDTTTTGSGATGPGLEQARRLGVEITGIEIIEESERTAQPLARQAEQREVLAHGRKEVAVHPLLLDAQHHHHVGAVDGFVERRRGRRAEPR